MKVIENQVVEQTVAGIEGLDQGMVEAVSAKVDQLTKPLGALGKLEKMVIRLGGIQRTDSPSIDKCAVTVMCGDHGIVDEGVSAYPVELTALMMGNFSREGAAINVLSRYTGTDVHVIDVGSKLDELPPGIVDAKVKAGTDNMAKGPAMSREEALKAIEVGIRKAQDLADKGYKSISLGDMGIGNTTPSAAIIAVISGKTVSEITGIGTGLTEEKRMEKARIIEKAIQVNGLDGDWRSSYDAVDVLARVGGLELAALAGICIGGAASRMAVVVDGVIAGASALIAYEMNNTVGEYIFASHQSVEPAHVASLEYMGLEAPLRLDMRLGEGTGAVLLYPLLEASLKIYNEMATFADLGL